VSEECEECGDDLPTRCNCAILNRLDRLVAAVERLEKVQARDIPASVIDALMQ